MGGVECSKTTYHPTITTPTHQSHKSTFCVKCSCVMCCVRCTFTYVAASVCGCSNGWCGVYVHVRVSTNMLSS